MKRTNTWQNLNIKSLDVLETAPDEPSDNLNDILNSKLNFPFRITISSTVLTIHPSECQVLKSTGLETSTDSYKVCTAPINKLYLNFENISTLDVSTGTINTGVGYFETSPEIPDYVQTAISGFVWLGFEARVDKILYYKWGENIAALEVDAIPPTFSKGTAIGMVLLEKNGAGVWNFKTPSKVKVFKGSGGGSGESGAGEVTEIQTILDSQTTKHNFDTVFTRDGGLYIDKTKNVGVLDKTLSDGLIRFSNINSSITSINWTSRQFFVGNKNINLAVPVLRYNSDKIDFAPTLEITRDSLNKYLITPVQPDALLTNIGHLAEYTTKNSYEEVSIYVIKPINLQDTYYKLLPINYVGLGSITVFAKKLGSAIGRFRISISTINNISGIFASTEYKNIADISSIGEDITLTFSNMQLCKAIQTYYLVVEIENSLEYNYSTGVTALQIGIDSLNSNHIYFNFDGFLITPNFVNILITGFEFPSDEVFKRNKMLLSDSFSGGLDRTLTLQKNFGIDKIIVDTISNTTNYLYVSIYKDGNWIATTRPRKTNSSSTTFSFNSPVILTNTAYHFVLEGGATTAADFHLIGGIDNEFFLDFYDSSSTIDLQITSPQNISFTITVDDINSPIDVTSFLSAIEIPLKNTAGSTGTVLVDLQEDTGSGYTTVVRSTKSMSEVTTTMTYYSFSFEQSYKINKNYSYRIVLSCQYLSGTSIYTSKDTVSNKILYVIYGGIGELYLTIKGRVINAELNAFGLGYINDSLVLNTFSYSTIVDNISYLRNVLEGLSIAGRGLTFIRPDGTQVEVTIDDNNQIAIYSV